MDYKIKSISNETELDNALLLESRIFAGQPFLGQGDYAKEAWMDRIKEYGDWMIYADVDGEVIGIVFGRPGSGNSVTVGPVAVAERYRKYGIARVLMSELEKRVKEKGYHHMALGSAESAECFYLKCGFTPLLLVQDNCPVILDDLRKLNTKYSESWCYDDGTDVRLCINTDGIDRELQHKYNKMFPNCSTQTLMVKEI